MIHILLLTLGQPNLRISAVMESEDTAFPINSLAPNS